MLYLLPDEQKKKVLREYRMRLAIVSLAALSFVGVVALATLAPTEILISSRQNILDLQQKSIEVSPTSNVDELSKKIMDISTKASILVPISAPISPAEVFMHLENEAGDATNIREFQLVHFDDNVSVQISGVSKNRDSLIKFINILKQDTAFTGATFPYSSLAKQDNLGFTLNMILNLKNFNATTTKS